MHWWRQYTAISCRGWRASRDAVRRATPRRVGHGVHGAMPFVGRRHAAWAMVSMGQCRSSGDATPRGPWCPWGNAVGAKHSRTGISLSRGSWRANASPLPHRRSTAFHRRADHVAHHIAHHTIPFHRVSSSRRRHSTAFHRRADHVAHHIAHHTIPFHRVSSSCRRHSTAFRRRADHVARSRRRRSTAFHHMDLACPNTFSVLTLSAFQRSIMTGI
jgi:hypothetical protein